MRWPKRLLNRGRKIKPQHERIGMIRIIMWPPADLDKADPGIELTSCNICDGNLQKNSMGAYRHGAGRCFAKQLGTDTAVTGGRGDGQGENFRLVRRDPNQDRATRGVQ